MSFKHQTIDIRGVDFHWLENSNCSKEAPLLVFLHGFPDNAYAWSHQLNAMAEKFYVVAPFVHGTCSTSAQEVKKERYERDSFALDVSTLINHLDPNKSRKLIFIGHDLGGVIGDKLTEFYSLERILGIIFINSLGLNQFYSRKINPFQLIKSYYIVLFQVPMITESILKATFQRSLKLAYDKGGLEADDELRLHGPEVFNGIKLYRTFLKDFIRSRKIERPKQSQVKALFIYGEKDKFLEIPTQHEVDKFYLNGEIRVLDANHWPQRTHNDRINDIIEKTILKWVQSND